MTSSLEMDKDYLSFSSIKTENSHQLYLPWGNFSSVSKQIVFHVLPKYILFNHRQYTTIPSYKYYHSIPLKNNSVMKNIFLDNIDTHLVLET